MDRLRRKRGFRYIRLGRRVSSDPTWTVEPRAIVSSAMLTSDCSSHLCPRLSEASIIRTECQRRSSILVGLPDPLGPAQYR